MSDSNGYIYDPDGIDAEKLAYIFELKNIYRGRIREYAEKYGCKYVEGARPWNEKCDIAMPSATQNEIDGDDARALLANGCFAVSEGANMPSTPEAIEEFLKAKILYAPGKAANAGGVSVSGRLCQLCKRRQRSRIYESGQSHDGSGYSLRIGTVHNRTKAANDVCGFCIFLLSSKTSDFLYFIKTESKSIIAGSIDAQQGKQQNGKAPQRRTSITKKGQRNTDNRQNSDDHSYIDRQMKKDDCRYTITINTSENRALPFGKLYDTH